MQQLRVIQRERRDALTLGSSTTLTEGDVRGMYAESGWDVIVVDGIVLILKLGMSLADHGMSRAGAEALLRRVAVRLQLPEGVLSLSDQGVLTAVFGNGPVHMICCSEAKTIGKLQDTCLLASAVAAGEVPSALAAAASVDEINNRPSPYGWAIEGLVPHLLSLSACLGAFGGTRGDFCAVALSSLPLAALAWAGSRSRSLSNLSNVVTPFIVGAISPVLTQRVLGLEPCHLPTIYLSLLLLSLPASVNASARLTCIKAEPSSLGSVALQLLLSHDVAPDAERPAATCRVQYCSAARLAVTLTCCGFSCAAQSSSTPPCIGASLRRL